jgi:hypothetical protein
MIETLLSYGGDAKESQLTSALFYKDQAGRMDAVTLAAATRNEGFFKRNQFSDKSHLIDMMGRIHADMFFQERYMLNEVNTKIKLIRSKDVFSLMGTAGHIVKIVSAVMLVRKVKLSPSIFLAHAKALERANAKYPIRRVVCKTFTVPAGYLDVSHEKLFSGQLPTRMVVGLVRNDAFNGALAYNPFNFQHFSLSEIAVYVDGQQQQCVRPLHPNFADEQYISSYVGLFSGTGKLNKDDGNNIERSEFAKGYALYAFDLSPDLAEDDHFNLSRQGGVRLALKFATALTVTVTVVAYAEFENVIEIDRNRNVVYDFSS